MLVSCAIRNLRTEAKGRPWLIVRVPPRNMRSYWAAGRGCLWMPQLAPSLDLLRWWRERVPAANAARPGTDEDRAAAWPEYVRAWRAEKSGNARYRDALFEAAVLAALGDLTIACYCVDPRWCHRSLVLADIHNGAPSLLAGEER